MNPDALIIFYKYPEHGKVKTRIAASLGEDFAFGLYNAFIRDLMAMSQSVQADKITAIDGPAHDAGYPFDFGTGYPVIRQEGADIGDRMLNALRYAFDSGYERAILVGSDIPDLPAEIINAGFMSLHESDAVVGRSTDGGYYLIGFKKSECSEAYFAGVDWSTPSVFQQTVDKMSAAGKAVSRMPDRLDIDDREDLKLFYDDKIGRGETTSHTMKYLVTCINNKCICL